MNCLIIGASSGLGRSLAYRLAGLNHNLVLVSEDGRDLSAIASDLRIRHGVSADFLQIDLGSPDQASESLRQLSAKRKTFDAVFIPAGVSDDSDNAETYPVHMDWILNVNFISVAKILSVLFDGNNAFGCKTVVGFGSVASIRGRRNNVIYAAAKRGLESCFESMRHAAAGKPVAFQFYKLGFMRTNLSFGKPTLLPKASIDRLAKKAVRNLKKSGGVWYYPGYWKFLSVAVRLIPWPVFKRLNF
jgi:decaprenylphospho-beta-D-erythro-pentofuranosid-2-ulose 2-reductase